MKLEEIIQKDKKYYMNTFGDRFSVCFTHGNGILLYDTEGNVYHDFFAGIAVNSLGHSHPALVNAICEQAKKLIHCSNLYYIEHQAKLAELIVKNSCADRVFFANSGAEANEGAIKLARLYFRKKGFTEKYEIITLDNSFHGRTLATIAATGQEKYQKPFSPLTPRFSKVPINDISALENAINENTCAVMLEPIQGESGVHPATLGYIKAVRELCDRKGILLVFDEVQCGLGRTGKLFAYQHYGVEPDIFTLAKGLGGGFPIGALCARENVACAFEPGDHGSTFGGNPLACSAGFAVLSTIINENLSANAAEVGDYFFEKMEDIKKKYPVIKEVRGKGLMIGIEFNKPIAKLINQKIFERKYLVGTAGESTLRILPPLIVTKKDMDGLIDVIAEALESIN